MKTLFRLLIAISLLFWLSVNANDIESGLSVVEQNSDEEYVSVDEEVNDNEEDMDANELFVPTDKWQTIRKGQVIPAGLHVRVNLETGLKEAKILDESKEQIDRNIKFIDKHKKAMESTNRVDSKVDAIRDRIKRVLQTMKFGQHMNDMEVSAKKSSDFRSIDEIKRDFDELNVKMHSESELLKSLIQKYKTSSVEEKVSLLADIEYLVHSIDIAQDFVQMNGIDVLVPDLNSTDSRLRAQIAFTIGSAMNGNPRVQTEVFKRGVLKELLLLLRYDSSVEVRKRSLFAISSLVRQLPSAQKSLVEEYGGLSIFANLFRDSDINSIKMSAKVITLLNDLLIERQLTLKYAESNRLNQLKRKLYEDIALNEAIIAEGFCDLVPNLLNSPDNDVREKTIEAMNSLSILCKKEFKKYLPILQKISNDFNSLSKSETKDESTDSYFTDLYELTSNLIIQLNSDLKDEF